MKTNSFFKSIWTLIVFLMMAPFANADLITGDVQDIITGDTQDLITGDIQDIITGDTQDLITGDVQDIITGDTQDLITGDLQDIITGDTQDLITGDIQDIITGDTQDLITGDVQDLITGDTQDLITGDLRDIITGDTQDLITGDVQDLITGDTQDLITGDVQDIITGDTQDLITGDLRDIITGDTQDLITGDVQDIITGDTQDLVTGDVQDLITGDIAYQDPSRSIARLGLSAHTIAQPTGLVEVQQSEADLVLIGLVESVSTENSSMVILGQTIDHDLPRDSLPAIGSYVEVFGLVADKGRIYADAISTRNEVYTPGASEVFVKGIAEIDHSTATAKLGDLHIDYSVLLSGSLSFSDDTFSYSGIQPIEKGLFLVTQDK